MRIPLRYELITVHLLKKAKFRFVDNYSSSIFLSWAPSCFICKCCVKRQHLSQFDTVKPHIFITKWTVWSWIWRRRKTNAVHWIFLIYFTIPHCIVGKILGRGLHKCQWKITGWQWFDTVVFILICFNLALAQADWAQSSPCSICAPCKVF